MVSSTAPLATPAAAASAARRLSDIAVWATSRTLGPGEAIAAQCSAAIERRVAVADTGTYGITPPGDALIWSRSPG